MGTALINPPGKIQGIGYIYGKNSYLDDTPFATFQSLDIKDDETYVELEGPEQYTALALGLKGRKVSFDLGIATFKLEQLLLARAGTINAVAAVTAPASAPTLTAASGSTTYTAGYIAVGYSWETPYGDTVVSALASVLVTSTQQITVSSLATALGVAGGTSVNYFMSSQSYATSAAALAAPVYYAGNTSGTSTVLPNYPLPATARLAPVVSSVSTARRALVFGTADAPSPCIVHFMTPGNGIDFELFAYNCVFPSVQIPFKLRDWTMPKFTVNVHGDSTRSDQALWTVLTV